MKINYHVHSNYSGDARKRYPDETIEKMVKAAINKGFDEICFTNHLTLDSKASCFWCSIDPKKMPAYKKDVSAAAKKHQEIRIKFGIEIDWLPNRIKEIRQAIARYNFDCILGSAHLVDGVEVELYHDDARANFWGKMSQKELHDWHIRYYKAVQDMIRANICDVVAHLDLINRDAYLPKKSLLSTIKQTLDLIKKHDLCIEVNTGGLRKPSKAIHPTFEILKLCKKKGIPITIGTDAHCTEQIDFGYDKAISMIKKAGYKELATFDKRKRITVMI